MKAPRYEVFAQARRLYSNQPMACYTYEWVSNISHPADKTFWAPLSSCRSSGLPRCLSDWPVCPFCGFPLCHWLLSPETYAAGREALDAWLNRSALKLTVQRPSVAKSMGHKRTRTKQRKNKCFNKIKHDLMTNFSDQFCGFPREYFQLV